MPEYVRKLLPALPFLCLAPLVAWTFSEPDRLFTGLGWLIGALLASPVGAALACLAGALVALRHVQPALSRPRRRACCRALQVNGADKKYVCLHEAGHLEGGKDRKSKNPWAELTPDHPERSGAMHTDGDRSARDAAIITAMGTEATNVLGGLSPSQYEDTRGRDREHLAEECAAAGISVAAAKRIARQDVRRLAGPIRRSARRLHETGHAR